MFQSCAKHKKNKNERKKMKRTTMMIVAVILCLTVVFAGCQKQEAPVGTSSNAPADEPVDTPTTEAKEKWTIGISLNDISSEWVAMVAEKAQIFADEHSDKIELVIADSALDMSKQIEDVENWITMGYDVICVKPVEAAAAKSLAEAAAEAGIYFIAMEDRLEGAATASIAQENITTGEDLAEAILSKIDYKGKVAIIYGAPGAKVCDERLQGHKNIIEKYPDVELVAEEPGNWLRADAMEITEAWINAGVLNDVNAIIASCDEMAIGAYLALEDAGLAGNYVIGSIDGTAEGLKYVNEGKTTLTMYAAADGMGYGTMEMAYEILTTGSTEDRILYCDVVDKDNIADYIDLVS